MADTQPNILIILADDHGYGDVSIHNGPYRGQKGDMYDGGIRVPACAMWPNRISSGAVTDQIALLMAKGERSG
ncbi:MAG: sulfatase-like hydrolase/transferase [bacterium]|nr:sulfatase-like hydrolase/transferase [bacterium]